MHATNQEMYALLLLTALAFAVPWISAACERWIRLPAVVLEIGLGMVVGKAGFNLLGDSHPFGVEFLALIGFNYLMFLSGLELDFTVLGSFRWRDGHGGWQRALREPFALAVLSFLGTLAVAAVGALIMSNSGLLGGIPAADLPGGQMTTTSGTIARGVLLALIFSTTSLGVVLPTLKESRLLGSDYGQAILVAVMVADFGTLFLLAVLEACVRAGESFVVSTAVVFTLLLLYLLLRTLGYRVRSFDLAQRLFDRFAHGTSQIKIRGTFALVMVFVAYSVLIGAEVILGAFLAGALVSLFSQQRDSEMRQKLDAIGYGFFVPIFFLYVGMDLEGGTFLGSWRGLQVLGLLFVCRIAARMLPAQVFRLRFDRSHSIAAGWLLSAQLSLTIAASQIGLRLGLIDGALNAEILLLAILTCLSGPLMFNRVWKPTPSEDAIRHILVVGSGQIAMFLGRRLARQGFSTTLVDHRRERLSKGERLGLNVCYEDPRTVAGLQTAGIDGAFALIAASGQDPINLAACRLARNVFGIQRVVARIQEKEYQAAYDELGIPTVDMVTATFMALDLMAVNPEVLLLASNVDDHHMIREAELQNLDLAGRTIHSLELPGDGLLLGLNRRGAVLVPHGETRVELGDRLVLIGSEEAVVAAVEWLERPGWGGAQPPTVGGGNPTAHS